MRPWGTLPEVFLCSKPVDFRKGINGLSGLVEGVFMRSPFTGHLFVFVNQDRDRVKVLYWESSGFCMWQKRLEKARFHWPGHLSKGETILLSAQELDWLLDGFDLRHWKPHPVLNFSSVS
jgi:transposase